MITMAEIDGAEKLEQAIEKSAVDSLVMPVVAVVDSTVRRNLLGRQGYSPYCGADRCYLSWPRTSFDGEQFKCGCGWRSAFDADFIHVYKAKWGK